MSKFIGGLALVCGMALVVSFARADDEDTKKAQKDVLDVAKDLEGGKNVDAKVAAIKKKYEDLNTVMHIYKPKNKGGIGYGPMGKGIELQILDWGKRAPAAGTLTKEKDDIVKVGYINLAMAKIAHAYAPAKPKGGKGAKEWKGFADDQEKATLELIDAAKKGNGAALKKAAGNINNACNNCHSDFRDS